MDTRYPVKKSILRLRDNLENEILLDNTNKQKILESSMDELNLLDVRGGR